MPGERGKGRGGEVVNYRCCPFRLLSMAGANILGGLDPPQGMSPTNFHYCYSFWESKCNLISQCVFQACIFFLLHFFVEAGQKLSCVVFLCVFVCFVFLVFFVVFFGGVYHP